MMRGTAAGYWNNERGAASAEFALVVIPFLVMIFAIIGLSTMFYANHTLQFAAEAAARCYSVDVTNCATSGATEAYAATRYSGPGSIAPVFVATATGCGHTVTATGTFQLDAIIFSTSVPLSASACFP
jgi:Flp pilus assembly protein TadG